MTPSEVNEKSLDMSKGTAPKQSETGSGDVGAFMGYSKAGVELRSSKMSSEHARIIKASMRKCENAVQKDVRWVIGVTDEDQTSDENLAEKM